MRLYLITKNNMRQFIDKAMEIANDRSQSMFHQREDFRELVEEIKEWQKEQVYKQIREQRAEDERREWENPRL